MKYAFLFGSNAFFVDKPVITYTADGNTTELLKVKSIYKPASKSDGAKDLTIDTEVTGLHNHTVVLTDNYYQHPDYNVHVAPNQIHVTDNNGNTVIDVLQLEPEAIHGLSSHVLNEYNTMGEVVFIRLRGDFLLGSHRITVDNEKFFIDDDTYAESVHVGHAGIELGPDGVTL